MKKTSILIAIISTLMFLSSCKGDSLKGTVWVTAYSSSYGALEFTSNSDVLFYECSSDLTPMGTVHYGTYSVTDSKVTFKNVPYIYYWGEYVSAIINGDFLIATLSVNGIELKSTDTFKKR